jgi:hypothetical protein
MCSCQDTTGRFGRASSGQPVNDRFKDKNKKVPVANRILSHGRCARERVSIELLRNEPKPPEKPARSTVSGYPGQSFGEDGRTPLDHRTGLPGIEPGIGAGTHGAKRRAVT